MLLSAFSLIALLACLRCEARFPQDEVYGPWPEFKTEPTFDCSPFNITHRTTDDSLLAPGYIFFSLGVATPGVDPWGPQIFDDRGNLVFYSMETPNSTNIGRGDPHPCDYLGSSGEHLCTGFARLSGVHKAVVNNEYQVIQTYPPVGPFHVSADAHEHNMLPGGYTFLQDIYVHKKADLTELGGPKEGHVLDGCLQELDVATGELIFQWCYLDHFNVTETRATLGIDAKKPSNKDDGNGSEGRPWDFQHINSVDKNSENDYIISFRHCDQIVKVAGVNNAHGLGPGTVIWSIGGKSNEFKGDFSFSRQHHVRYISTGAEETVISVFDNAFDFVSTPDAPYTSGKLIAINNRTMTAYDKAVYPHPDEHYVFAQGSTQIIPYKNSYNVFIEWGWQAEVSEFDSAGNLLLHAMLNDRFDVNCYRGFKSPWVGRPPWPPKLLAYSRSCGDESPLVAYVSWNGATEVRSWRFHISNYEHGPWISVGTFPKIGFETAVTLLSSDRSSSELSFLAKKSPNFARFVSVEALAEDGSVLGTTVNGTFVPLPNNEIRCDDLSCYEPSRFEYHPEYNGVELCPISKWRPGLYMGVIALLIYLFGVEGGIHIWHTWSQMIVRRPSGFLTASSMYS